MTPIDLAAETPAQPPETALQPDQGGFRLTSPHPGPVAMQVTKRSGDREPVNLDKIVRAVTRCCDGLADVDPMRVALKTIAGLYDGASTRELDELSIRTAASFIAEEPEYSKAAARLLAGYIDKEVQGLGIYSFSQSIRHGFDAGLDYPSDGDPAALAAYESAALHATAAALADPARAFAWADLPEEWLWEADDIEALAAMNAHPEVVLDAVHIAPCLPSGMGLLANLPNGYFSGDWTPFATHAVAERLRRQGYTLRGIGARCLWFARTTTPSPSETDATISDLQHLYGN